MDRTRGFGFIEYGNPNSYIFFHKSGVLDWFGLDIYDKVQFEITESTIPAHLGKPKAVNIQWHAGFKSEIEKKFSREERWVGKLTQWNRQNGYLEVANLSKRIYLKHTTLAHCKPSDLHAGSILIVCPVKSTIPHSEYFARFAYPLSLETNPDFLNEAWEKNYEADNLNVADILSAIEVRLWKVKQYSHLWQLNCLSKGESQNANRLQEVIKMIDKFNHHGYEPTLNELDKAANGDSKILIALLLSDKTKHFKPDKVSAFFKTTSDELRKQILMRVDGQYRARFLIEYAEYLARHGKMNSITPRLNFILQAAKQWGEYVYTAVLAGMEPYFKQFDTENKVRLWVRGAFNESNVTILFNQIDLKNTALWLDILSSISKEEVSYIKDILDLFLNKADRKSFDDWYPYFIPVMQMVNEKWPGFSSTVRPRLVHILSQDQLLTLGLLGLKEYLPENPELSTAGNGRWPMYALIRYILVRRDQGKITAEAVKQLIEQKGLSTQHFLDEIPGMPWSQVLQPCKAEKPKQYEIGYLENIIEAFQLAGISEPRIHGDSSLATCIFDSVKEKEPFHARLWFKEYVPRNYYDYEGFREPYKELTKAEKRLFVRPAKDMMDEVVEKQVVSEIPSCQNFQELGTTRIYSAKLKNIHFEKDKYRLKTPEGFTEWGSHNGITHGFNFIAGSREFDIFNIEIRVKNNFIVQEGGLTELLDNIIQKQLVASLRKKGKHSIESEEVEPSYPDNLLLQEQILHHLKSIQAPNQKIILVKAHIFEFERQEEDESSNQATTGIFTVELEDGYGLIWEFYDLNHQNATYVFKVNSHHYEVLVDRLIQVISLRRGIRAALNAKNQKHPEQMDLLNSFRAGLGYIANIKIKRGMKGAFNRWEKKLDEKLRFPIPGFIEDHEWLNALDNLKLEDSRNGYRISTKTRRSQGGKKDRSALKEDNKVKSTNIEEGKIIHGSNDAEPVADQVKIEKLRELNILLNSLLTNEFAP